MRSLKPDEENLLLEVLADGEWHWNDELSVKVGWRFGATIKEARSKGYSIATEQQGKKYRYRLIINPTQFQTLENVKSAIPKILEQVPYFKLLVLFGSRARGDHEETSDWDIAVLYDEDQRKEYEKGGFDWLRGWSIIQQELDLPDDDIDVVDLGKCSNILAHAIACDGKLLYEREPGEFEQFHQQALMSKAELKAFCAEQKAIVKEGLERLKK